MLTKTDLNQIRKIVREEVEIESNDLRKGLQGEIKLSRMGIQTDIKKLTQRTKNLEIQSNKMQKDITQIKKTTTKTQKDLVSTINFFDKEHIETVRRVKRVEQHIGFASV